MPMLAISNRPDGLTPQFGDRACSRILAINFGSSRFCASKTTRCASLHNRFNATGKCPKGAILHEGREVEAMDSPKPKKMA